MIVKTIYDKILWMYKRRLPMNKKTLILLIIAIILLIVALALFFYAKSLESNHKMISNNTSLPEENTIASYFYDIDGNQFYLNEFSDKPIVLLLWKSDNAKSYPMIQLMTQYYESYQDKVYFLVINVNEPDIDLDLIDNVKAVDFQIPIYFDTDLTLYHQFSYEKLPSLFFLSQEGEIEKKVLETITEDSFVANLDLLISNY